MRDNSYLSKVTHDSVEDKVYGRIRQAILTGALPAGERLVHDDLAARFGTSRIPVRDALKRLVYDGLVDTRGQRAGYQVATFGRADIDEIYALRILLETRAVRAAAQQIEPQALAALESLQSSMEAAANADDRERYVEQNQAFHQQLYDAAGQPRLAKLIDNLWRGLPPLTPLSMVDTLAEVVAEHRPILAALAARDADAAAAAMIAHIERAHANARDHIDATGRLI